MVSAKTMANGYQPTKGETWGEEPVAHTFDLTHRIRGLSTPTTSTLDTHASFFAVFSWAKRSRRPPKVTTKPHTETHPYKYLGYRCARHTAGWRVGVCEVAGVVGGDVSGARSRRICSRCWPAAISGLFRRVSVRQADYAGNVASCFAGFG